MRHSEGTFKAADGLNLFEQRWLPDGDAKAVVLIVHGYAEHSSRYTHTAEHLTHQGYAVYSFDLRGHGRSEGRRGYVRSFGKYLSDLRLFLKRVNEQEKAKPIFILGHSMGGTIVTLFSTMHSPDIRGLILSGPLLRMSDKISRSKRVLISVTGFFTPKLPVIKKINHRLISTDPNAAAKYDSDPLVYHGKLPARQGREINKAVNSIQKRMESVLLPLLILHGTGDSLVDMKGSKQLHARAGSTDKTLKLYKGFYHEVLNERGRNQVLADIVAWLNTHL